MGTRMGELSSFEVGKVLMVVYEVLIMPECEDAVERGVAREYEEDLEGFEMRARKWTRSSAPSSVVVGRKRARAARAA